MIEDRNVPVGTVLAAKGRTCTVEPGKGKSGISFRLDDGQIFGTPSAAGSEVLGGKAVNGWAFWSISIPVKVIKVIPIQPQGNQTLDVTPFHTETEEPAVDPFEAISQVRTSYWDNECPFRGLPFRPQLDERCPSVVPCIATPVEVSVPQHLVPTKAYVHVGPALQEDTYCWTCVHDHVREEEAGISIGRKGQSVRKGR